MNTCRNVCPPLETDLRDQLRALVEREGDVAVARRLGIGRQTVLRALAGLGVRAGTAVLIGYRLQHRKVA